MITTAHKHDAILSALHETTMGLMQQLDTKVLLKDIINRAARLVGTDDGYIFLFDPERNDLSIEFGIGRFEKYLGLRFKSGEGLSGKVWQTGTPMKIDDYESWSGRHPFEGWDGMGYDLGVPLYAGQQQIGVIGLCSYDKTATIGDTEISVLTQFAELASIALANAELHANLQRELNNRIAAQNALQKSESKFRKLFAGSPIWMALASLDGTYIEVNDAFTRISKYTRDEVIGRTSTELKLWETPDKRAEAIAILVRDGRLDAHPVRFRMKDGRIRDMLWSAKLIDLENQQCTLSGLLDVSAQKETEAALKALEESRLQAEAQLRQSQKMEAIGTLAGGIAHDFNNILSAILGYSELIAMETAEDSEIGGYARDIIHASQRATDLVKQILTFSRKTDQKRSPLQIQPILKETARFLRSSLPTTIEIRLHIAKDIKAVMADATQIHQIIMNLCSNAAHAMREAGGYLDIHLANRRLAPKDIPQLSALKPGPFVKLVITDSGHGIAPEVIDSIFDPYFSTKKKGEGTGLGLSVVHGIVTAYGGHVTVDSQVGQGSRFTILLPAIPSRILPENEESTDLPQGSEHILMVDDERSLVEIGRSILEKLGYRVTTATSSGEALEIFRQKPESFDLVLTDMTMPQITGEKLAVEVLGIRPQIPVILCTGYSSNISETKASRIGIKALVYKPINIETLSRTLRSVLDQKGKV